MSHKHLNYLQRCQILALWKAGILLNKFLTKDPADSINNDNKQEEDEFTQDNDITTHAKQL